MQPPTGQIPIVSTGSGDTEPHERSPDELQSQAIRDTIPQMPGSDGPIPGSEESDESDMPKTVPLEHAKMPIPETEVIRERTRSVLAVCVTVVVTVCFAYAALRGMQLDAFLSGTLATALAIVLGYYFATKRMKKKIVRNR